jgi:hypothetical protein
MRGASFCFFLFDPRRDTAEADMIGGIIPRVAGNYPSSWPVPSCRVHLAIRPDTKQKHQRGRVESASADKRAHLGGAHLFGESASV